jgi:hypothetical protein
MDSTIISYYGLLINLSPSKNSYIISNHNIIPDKTIGINLDIIA